MVKKMKRLSVLSTIIAAFVLIGLMGVAPTHAERNTGSTIVVSPYVMQQNTTATVELSGFRPNETVTMWQTLPDWSVIGLGNYDTDKFGNAVLSWHADPSLPTGKHYMSVRGNNSRRVAVTEFEVVLAEGMAANTQMSVSTTTDEQGNTFRFNAVGFGEREMVSVWLRTPGDQVMDLGYVISSKEGSFDYTLPMGGDRAAGVYHLTAYGNKTFKTAIASFELQRGDTLNAVSSPMLYVYPTTVEQGNSITIEGESFGSQENISSWITMPNGRAVALFEKTTERDGFFVVDIELPEEVIPGKHTITVFGKMSGLRATATLNVTPRVR